MQQDLIPIYAKHMKHFVLFILTSCLSNSVKYNVAVYLEAEQCPTIEYFLWFIIHWRFFFSFSFFCPITQPINGPLPL